MKNWTLRRRILASFAVVIAILMVTVVISYVRLAAIESDTDRVTTDALPGLFYSAVLRQDWVDSFVQTEELFTSDHPAGITPAERDAFAANRAQLETDMKLYRESVFRNKELQQYEEFVRVHDAYEQSLASLLAAYASNQQEDARHMLNGALRNNWRAGRDAIYKLIDDNKTEAESATDAIKVSVGRAKITLLAAVLVAIAAAIVCGLVLMRAIMNPMQQIVQALNRLREGDLTTRLALERNDEFGVIEAGFNATSQELMALVSQSQHSAIQVATSVTEIAATAQEQQATATEAAATTSEIGATSREIAATSRDLVRTMGEVSGAAEQASTLAGAGQLGLARMEDTMAHVMSAAELVNAKLAILNEKAGNINQVVTTIVKVADQTNLLSLNAAIEAEKAGEYGRGFAVVATEVRRLADQTAIATYDIEQMVREIQSAVSAGVMGMDKFSEDVRRGIAEVQQVGEQLTQIIQQVQALAPRVQLVNEGMHAQATGAEQINLALTQLSEATGQTVESLRQTSMSIDELNMIAGGLRNGVSRFKV